MAEEIENEGVEIEEEAEELEAENESEEEESESEESEEESGEEESEEESVIVTIGEETPSSEEEPGALNRDLPKKLREEIKERNSRIRELEEKLAVQNPKEEKAALGPMPKIDDDDIDYDSEKHAQKLAEWYERKQEHDKAQARIKEEQEAQAQAWNSTLESYGKARNELKVPDYEEAEFTVQETLSEAQQGMILQGADNPALVVYALGKNPKKAKELSSINDPVKFAFAVGKLETTLKVTNRKAKTQPEKKVQGTGSKSGAMDSTLERLEKEADKTGDRTKVVQYKRKLKQQKAS